MPDKNQVALSFLALEPRDFSYTVYRRRLSAEEQSVPNLRYLPENPSPSGTGRFERIRYEVSFEEAPGFEAVTLASWIDGSLTQQVIYEALKACLVQQDLTGLTETPAEGFKREVLFHLHEHEEGVREVIKLRPYWLRSIGRFGFLCNFNLRVPLDSTISQKRRLELSLTQRNGRVNEAYYHDQYGKIGEFIKAFHSKIQILELHDGTRLELSGKLSRVPSFRLDTRTYVFSGNKESKNQFFGLRDNGPFKTTDPNTRLAFLFLPEDRPKSQDLYRALRGDTYLTFTGMEKMFRTTLGRDNVSGTEVANFEPETIRIACETIQEQFVSDRILPVAIVPYSKHVSSEQTLDYYRAKHTFLKSGMASQFVDRTRTMDDHNALKWSISNIALAVFAKMGGVPWRIKPSTKNCLIVGIGQAHRVNQKVVEKYIAYSVLTDSSGIYESIRMLGSSTDKDEYLAKLTANLRSVLTSHKGQYHSFVLHVTFKMRHGEMEAIKKLLDELKAADSDECEFIVIKFNDHNDFFGFSTEHNSLIPNEGTVVSLSKKEFALWFSGVSTSDSKAPKKPEKPVHLQILYPSEPLGESDLKRLLQDTINIAGANWRGFNAKSMPISVYYAKLIADYYSHFRQAGLEEVDMDNLPPWFL